MKQEKISVVINIKEVSNTFENFGGGQRDITVDIVKGIGIVLMVVRHASAPFSDFVLLFHMAIFFIASGYLLYGKNRVVCFDDVILFVKRKLKSLYLPYVVYNICFVMLNNIFLKLNIYTDNLKFLDSDSIDTRYKLLMGRLSIYDYFSNIVKILLFQGGTQIGGALWFFQTLFIVLICYVVVQYIFGFFVKEEGKKIVFQTMVAFFMLLVGYFCQIHKVTCLGFDRVCSVYILIHIGVLLKQFDIIFLIYNKVNTMLILLLSFGVLILGYNHGYISISGNKIENPLFFVCMSLAGWMLLYSLSFLLTMRNYSINNIFIYISRNSVSIVALHFLCFKVISLIAIHIYNMDDYMLAAFPILMYSGYWWILYSIIGIGGSLLLDNFISHFAFMLSKNCK